MFPGTQTASKTDLKEDRCLSSRDCGFLDIKAGLPVKGAGEDPIDTLQSHQRSVPGGHPLVLECLVLVSPSLMFLVSRRISVIFDTTSFLSNRYSYTQHICYDGSLPTHIPILPVPALQPHIGTF